VGTLFALRGRSNVERAGVPEKVGMTLMGHKTRSIYDRYNIIVEEDMREAVAKLAAEDGEAKAGTAHS
jgi:hypothetical protein